MSATNRALARTDMIFCGLRTIRWSEARPSQNSSGWASSRFGAKPRKASSNPGHLASITLHTKPAEKIRLVISASARSSPSLASALELPTFGSRAASAASPPLRLAARARMVLKAVMGPALPSIRLQRRYGRGLAGPRQVAIGGSARFDQQEAGQHQHGAGDLGGR